MSDLPKPRATAPDRAQPTAELADDRAQPPAQPTPDYHESTNAAWKNALRASAEPAAREPSAKGELLDIAAACFRNEGETGDEALLRVRQLALERLAVVSASLDRAQPRYVEDEDGDWVHADRAQPPAQPAPDAWLDEIEQRIEHWRVPVGDENGDHAGLRDLIGAENIESLIDEVCSRFAPFPAGAAQPAPDSVFAAAPPKVDTFSPLGHLRWFALRVSTGPYPQWLRDAARLALVRTDNAAKVDNTGAVEAAPIPFPKWLDELTYEQREEFQAQLNAAYKRGQESMLLARAALSGRAQVEPLRAFVEAIRDSKYRGAEARRIAHFVLDRAALPARAQEEKS